MEIIRCENGHFYDAEASSTCPQCEAEKEMGPEDIEDIDPTMPVVSVRGGIGQIEDTDPTIPAGFDGGDKTFQPIHDSDYPVTEVAGGMGVPFSPAAGWLVCTEGPARGTDYRVRCGYNYIGRSEHMDICIRGDNKISRERHALVAYDEEERVFFFGPADGKSIVRVNGKSVMGPTEIYAYDILSVGATKLLFVPLCGERFNWDE